MKYVGGLNPTHGSVIMISFHKGKLNISKKQYMIMDQYKCTQYQEIWWKNKQIKKSGNYTEDWNTRSIEESDKVTVYARV